MKKNNIKLFSSIFSGIASIFFATTISACSKKQEQDFFLIRGSETINVGETKKYEIELKNLPKDTPITWSSSDINIAVVDQNGNVTAKRRGTFFVMAQALNYYNANLRVQVVGENTHITVDPTDITISGPDSLINGKSSWFHATVLPEEADQNVTWQVIDNPQLVLLKHSDTPDVEIIPLQVGVITIKVSTDLPYLISKTQTISIYDTPREISIDGPVNLTSDSEYNYSTEIRPSTSSQDVAWSVSPSELASIDEFGNLKTNQQSGVVTITAKSLLDDSISTSIQANICDPEIEPTSLEIIGDDSIQQNAYKHYNVVAQPQCAFSNVTWSIDRSRSECDATIDSKGNLRATSKTGKLVICAKSQFLGSSIIAEKIINVVNSPFSIDILGPDAINVNQTAQLDIVADPSDAKNDVVWTIDNPNIAYVDKNGYLTSFSEGVVVVTATNKFLSTITATKKITITQSQILSVTFGQTIGQGHTFIGNNFALFRKKYEIYFLSTTLEKNNIENPPIHKEMTPNDLEIIIGGQQLKEGWHLSHNKLTIDEEYVTANIQINILGVEIADWISWDDLAKFTSKDTKLQEAKKFYQIGDYKTVTNEFKPLGFARIIDMYKDITTDDGVDKPLPFTFEFAESINHWCYFMGNQSWQLERRYANSELRSVLVHFPADSVTSAICYSVNKWDSTEMTQESAITESFFALSPKEMGIDAPEWDTHSTLYAYYDDTQYISCKTIPERIFKPKCHFNLSRSNQKIFDIHWTRCNYSNFYSYAIHSSNNVGTLIIESDCLDEDEINAIADIIPAFCI